MQSALSPKKLSPKQERILASCRRGGTYKEIADQLGVSEATVKSHMERMFQKRGVHNVRELLDAVPIEPEDQRPISIPITFAQPMRLAA